MIRKLLELMGITLSDAEFSLVMKMTTEDIRFNNTHFGKKTSLLDMLDIAKKSASIVRRYCH